MRKFQIPNIEDGLTATRTVRFKKTTLEKLEKYSSKHNMSVNKLITLCVDYAFENLDENEIITEEESGKI